MAEHALDKKLIHSPVEEVCGNPKDLKPGGGTWDGQPGLPKRTPSDAAVPEKTFDDVK